MELETPEISRPTPKDVSTVLMDSLVILFLRSFVTTSPRGARLANYLAEGGLSWILSLSSWGYKSTTFWLYLIFVNSVGTALSAIRA